MLAHRPCLMFRPKLLCIDEPSTGLALSCDRGLQEDSDIRDWDHCSLVEQGEHGLQDGFPELCIVVRKIHSRRIGWGLLQDESYGRRTGALVRIIRPNENNDIFTDSKDIVRFG